MAGFPAVSSKGPTRSIDAASGRCQLPNNCPEKGAKPQSAPQRPDEKRTKELSRSLSSTVQLSTGVKKRALLVAVNLTIMLASLIVLWHALYSYTFRPSQPYPFWLSLVSKSLLFTLFLHLDVFFLLLSSFFALASGTGLVGVLRENASVLKVYEVFVIVITVVLSVVTALALAFPYGAKWSSSDASSHVDFIQAYRHNPDFQRLIDSVQSSLHCCGFSVESFRDWRHNDYYRCDLDNPSIERCSVPASCCKTRNSTEESTGGANLRCAQGVLLMNDQAAWDVVYTRSCVDACHVYFENNFRFYAIPGLLAVIACLALLFVTNDVHGEIASLRLIYRKYYEVVHEGQAAMREAGIIQVLQMNDSEAALKKASSKTISLKGTPSR